MDFATGRTLREVMQQAPLPIARVMRIAQQLLSGLAHAHAQGIVHRDLKPENLILGGDSELEEHLRILDFGLAKLRDGPAMTAGLAVGTPSYMSPEQSGGSGAVDARTDLYTVGVLLFEILAGRKPFQSENVGEVILMHREALPPRLREVAPSAGYSAALEAVLDKTLAKLPEDRFQTAPELAAALAATPEGQGKPIAAPPARAPAKTTIDTVSAVRRRLGKLPGDPPSAPASPAATSPARPLRVGGVIAGFALLVLVLLALTLGRGLRRRSGDNAEATSAAAPVASSPVGPPSAAARPPAGTPPAAPPSSAVPAPSAPEDPGIEQARQLVAAGQTPQAIELLERLRSEKPNDADAPYLLATIYFDGHRWTEGLSSAQVAMKKNPAFRTDGDLIRGAIRSLVSDPVTPRAQSFLRGLGPAAQPFLKEAARRDPSPKVRERAGELVGGGHGWSGGARSSTGMFKR
jgi:eukaryotic-like serine/threonine-protein kinase